MVKAQLMPARRRRFLLPFIACLAVSLAACAIPRGDGPGTKDFAVRSLMKTDIDTVAEFHVETMRVLLERLMVKLYRRNPRELAKSDHPAIADNVRRLFSHTSDFDFPELQGRRGTDAVHLAVDESYGGDRVFAFVAGLTDMVMKSFEYKMEFYLFDSLDPQKLYNCARNIEIAVWQIGHTLDSRNELFLLTNSLPHERPNLSYERLFGKLIATQDNMALIMADKKNRVIKKTVQNMATAVFLPI